MSVAAQHLKKRTGRPRKPHYVLTIGARARTHAYLDELLAALRDRRPTDPQRIEERARMYERQDAACGRAHGEKGPLT